MKKKSRRLREDTSPLSGALVKIPMPGKVSALDGFWYPGRRRHRALLVFVHGMGGNFYRSPLKRAFMRDAANFGMDALCFNNRGTGNATQTERFAYCLVDLESVRRWARALGYTRIVWVGHSTGCQKAAHYLARRKPADAAALVLLAPADDLAIVRRQTGRKYAADVRYARARVRKGGPGADRSDPKLSGFSPRRFLSIALPGSPEARIFDYSGRLTAFASLRLPILAVFGTQEKYACRPVEEMGEILGARSRSDAFEFHLVPGGDHSFRSLEGPTVRRCLQWIQAHL